MDELSQVFVNVKFNKIKNCSKCSKNLDDSMIICPSCNSVGYCSRDCQVSDTRNHKKTCDLEKIRPIITMEMTKIFYLEKTSHPDPEIIEAIDRTIEGIKSGTRGEHEKTNLVRAIMLEQIELTKTSLTELRRAQEYTQKQYDDFVAGRRGL
jgi:hypothetical protein